MKESTGAVSAIYVVIFFVVIMFGFIISTLSYYKSSAKKNYALSMYHIGDMYFNGIGVKKDYSKN